MVDLIDVRPDHRVLEIGCGRGIAIDLVCRRLGRGHVVGLDRSRTAIDAARALNAPWLEAGIASLVEGPVHAVAGLDGSFDVIFAMNVNLFWTRAPAPELELLQDALAEGGVIRLGWEAPSADRAEEILRRASGALDAAGLDHETVRSSSNPALVCLTARRR